MALNFSRQDKVFVGIIMLVHVIYFLLACHYTRIYMGDSFEYIYEALNIKNHFFFYSGNPAMPIVPEYMTQRQPGYPLFLLAVYLFTVNNWVVIVLQNLLSVFNIYYARKVFISIGYQARYDWLLLMLVIAYPAQFINANTIAPDILLQTCTLIYFGCFVWLLQGSQWKYALWMSAALTAGMMVKPVLYPFVFIHILLVLVLTGYHKLVLSRMTLIAITPLCAMLLYCGWNYERTGKFHYTSNQAFNASYYFVPYFSYAAGADSANRFLQNARAAYYAMPEYKDRYDHANEQGMALLEQNFFPYMLFHLKNSARMFIEPGKGEMDLFTGRLSYGRLYSKEQTGFYATWEAKGWGGMGEYMLDNPSLPVVLLVFLFNCVRLFGLIVFFVNRNVHFLLRLFVALFAGYFALATGPIANTRYFLPVSLVVTGGAVLGFIHIMTGRRKTKR